MNSIIPDKVCIHLKILSTYKFDPDVAILEDTMWWIRITKERALVTVEESTVLCELHSENTILPY